MLIQKEIKSYYLEHHVPNPINVTFTEKQFVEGQRLDDATSEQNFQHFRNLLNRHLFGNAYKRHGKKLAMFVVREESDHQRHHLHAIIEKPRDMPADFFMTLVKSCWKRTRFGHEQLHYEEPKTQDRKSGWVNYTLKKRTKPDFPSSIDWVNSTCFERC